MDNDIGARIAGLAGAAFVVLGLVGNFAPGQPPDADAPVAEIRDFLVDGRSSILLAGVLQLLAIVAFLVFVSYIRHAVVGEDMWGTAFMAAAVVGSVAVGVSGMVFSSMVWVDGFVQEAGDDVIRLAWSATFLLFAVTVAATALLLGTFAFAALRGDDAPSWLGWIAAAGAVLSLAGIAMAASPDTFVIAFASFFFMTIWVAATSILLVLRRTPAEARFS